MMSSTIASRRPISFVICAAGRGERFVHHGLTTPKPLLLLNGKTMLERSLESIEATADDQIIIITQKDHQIPQKLSTLRATWLEIDGMTRGQLDTFYRARDLIQHDEVVIYNCDTYFTSPELTRLLADGSFDGIIPCSVQPGNAWSFCRVDETNKVLEVAEKRRISDWASVGYYYFKGKDLLLQLAQEELSTQTEKEVYVAPLYERYLRLGLKIQMAPVKDFLPFGTIEQVKDYWGLELHDLLAENK